LYENAGAILGLTIAFLGVYFGHLFNNPYIDGVASILIGLVLILIAILLVNETRGLLIGESADQYLVKSISNLAAKEQGIEEIAPPLTMHFGPQEILLVLNVRFHRNLSTIEIEKIIDHLEAAIRSKHPQIRRIYIEANAISKSKQLQTGDSKLSVTNKI
jgi:divalent metal cation (Fe/Co/Zn/Cd) transporter